jgi:homoserine kinase type II
MAVYTEVTDEDLTPFLERYDLGALVSFKGIAEGVENSNFLLHTSSGYFILTLYEKRVASELPFFLGLMQHLAAGHRLPTPIHEAAAYANSGASRPPSSASSTDVAAGRRRAIASCPAGAGAMHWRPTTKASRQRSPRRLAAAAGPVDRAHG